MSESTAQTRVAAHERRIGRALLAAWWSNLAIWAALLVLLFVSLGCAYLPLGVWNLPLGVIIAAIKAGLVVYFFMQMNRAKALVRLSAAAALLFVSVLFALSLTDLFTRL